MPQRFLTSDDRGAVLIHVALGVLALTAFLTIVADFGLMWTSRRQAQNSADAGAMAGAIALAFDDPSDYSNSGPAKQNAYGATQTNLVWGQPPHVDISTNITFPLLPTAFCDPDGDGLSQCVRAEVFRNTDSLNALPMLFGHILGLSQQNTKASAIAVAAGANSSNCLKPWGVADKWHEADGSFDPTDTFDPPGDDYRYPGEQGPDDPGTGYKAPPADPNDYGQELILKVGQPGDAINPGWFQALRLGVCTGANCYRDEISGCVNSPYGIGDDAPKENGNMVGPTAQGVADLIALDEHAEWDPGTKSIINSCVGPPYTCSQSGYAQSPRVVAIPVFDLELYLATGGTTGNGRVRIVNILGFFVDHMGGYHGNDVVGYLINKIETIDPNKGIVPPNASFIKSIFLIR